MNDNTENNKTSTFSIEEISQKAQALKAQYGENFSVNDYLTSAKDMLNKGGKIDDLNPEKFLKEESDNKKSDQFNDGENLSYKLQKKDGKFIARGSDGTIIEGKNFEEINDKICSQLKAAPSYSKEKSVISFTGKDPEEQKIFSRNAIMKHGIAIKQGFPEDQQFWQDLKKEYLNDKSHSLDEWERMTRKLPDDVLQRTPEESKRNKERNMKEFREKLKQGHNYDNANSAQPAKNNTRQNEANKKEFDVNLIYKNKKNNNSL